VGECPGGGKQGESWKLRGKMTPPNRMPIAGLKPKDLCGIPWHVAFALQADGWYLRSDIIWSKPNPMPESVTDRPTKAHEYLFLLSKRERYYYDADAVREPAEYGRREQPANTWDRCGLNAKRVPGTSKGSDPSAGRNRRTVWEIATQPYNGAHFATFPEALVEPCILAGSRVGDVVLDPFFGSGTVGQVAQNLGRKWLGCELNSDYAALQHTRTAQQGLELA
jgi:site-specific DNA-methyltransferase (cytosine-N4-specific)